MPTTPSIASLARNPPGWLLLLGASIALAGSIRVSFHTDKPSPSAAQCIAPELDQQHQRRRDSAEIQRQVHSDLPSAPLPSGLPVDSASGI